jgi:hypothetical protein
MDDCLKLGDLVTVKGRQGVGKLWATNGNEKEGLVRYEDQDIKIKWIPFSQMTKFVAPVAVAA